MENKSNGISATFLLFVVFLVLKLTNVIEWSWWWISSPIWIPVSIGVVGLIVKILFMPTKKERSFKSPEPLSESKFAKTLREAQEKQKEKFENK